MELLESQVCLETPDKMVKWALKERRVMLAPAAHLWGL